MTGVQTCALPISLAWSQDLPVIPVSSLQALAQAAYRLTGLQQVTAVLDARMQEVYIANFCMDEHGIMQTVDEEKLLDYQQAVAYQKYTLIGSGATLVDAEATKFQQLTANANDIATIARQHALKQQWLSAEQALPVYLRDNAWKKIPEQGKP